MLYKKWLYLICILSMFVFNIAVADGYRYVFFEDFSEGAPALFPPGWSLEDSNADLVTWAKWDIGGRANSSCARYLSSPAQPANDWFFTPAVSLTASTPYTLSFLNRVTSAAFPHNLEAWIGSAPASAGMTSLISSLPAISNVDALESSPTFTVASSGSYYIGFKCLSIPNHLALFVDNIGISIPESSLQVILQMDKTFYNAGAYTYSPDEAKKCLVYIQNSGASPLSVNSFLNVGASTDQSVALSFQVIDPDGIEVPYKAIHKVGRPDDTDFVTLATGELIYKNYDLQNGVFDFTKTGDYTVRALYHSIYKPTVGSAWQGVVISQPVTIRIQ